MSEEHETTFEGTLLDSNPDLRKAALGSKDFQAWRADLPSVVVDGVQFFIRGGDMLKDEDQVIVEWAHRVGLLPDNSETKRRGTLDES